MLKFFRFSYPRWLTLLVLFLPLTSQANPALWQAQKGHQTLYFFGSIHIGSKKLYPLPKAALKAFANSSRLWVEVDTRYISDQVREQIRKTVTLPEDQTLADLLPASLQHKLRQRSQSLGLSMTQLQHLYPWYVSILISQHIYQKLGYTSALGIDQFFLNKATHTHKPVSSLETVTQQFQALATLKDDQNDVLQQTLATDDSIKTGIDDTIAAWRSGNQERLIDLLQQDQKGIHHQEQVNFQKNLLTQRNRRWLKEFTQIKSEQPQFVVVGALHLAGKQGVLALLKQTGYTIKRIH
ncbi:TraB/GumN family protein [Celerinatantimonas yamalensis]|uniref:TraB/GumN family protein n=1 Tax=Celerinatantimonas yamalensis TaxID=559956 RepID=A0ABW9G3I5_9GAMM